MLIYISAKSEDGGGGITKGEPASNLMYIFVGLGSVLILTLIIVVMIGRKRARGITWFPEGFFSRGSDAGATARTSKRHGPDGGEEMK